ncbi:MAG: hypothetical protein JKX80_02865 [Candidatus Pacebacteria bacterium]|nr:hypothetical protein [Candidatus Paceibacterota bacterium]
MNTIEEAQAVFNKVLNAYVVPLQKQKLVGGVMGFVENPKEICMILPIFHHSDVPREDMLSLSEVESVLEEVGYLKEEN